MLIFTHLDAAGLAHYVEDGLTWTPDPAPDFTPRPAFSFADAFEAPDLFVATVGGEVAS
jgi:hypothetical protein